MAVTPDAFAHWVYHLMPSCGGRLLMVLEVMACNEPILPFHYFDAL